MTFACCSTLFYSMQKPYIAANVKKLNMNNKQRVLVLRSEHNEPSFVENQNRISIQIYF